jgi:hypothetical protein
MPLLARTPSLPFSTNKPTALQARVNERRETPPHPGICPDERVDFDERKVDPSFSKRCQRFEWALQKIGAELLVCQNLSDD